MGKDEQVSNNNQEEKTQKRLEGYAKISNFILDLGFWAKLSPALEDMIMLLNCSFILQYI